MVGTRGSSRRSGFVSGFRGGSGHRSRHVFGRSTPRHQFKTRPFGFQRFHRGSRAILNLGGFVYPPYYYYDPYYPPFPYYPSYPSAPIPYDPGYPAVDVPYPYPDPVATYERPIRDNVQVYTAPPDPAPASPHQPWPTPGPPAPPPQLDDGSLHFEINPPEAKVFLDERYLGEAHELRDIAEITAPAGRHLLEIRTDMERTFTEVVVTPRKVTQIYWPPAATAAVPAGLSREDGRND
jgi:hypothetical protein